MRHWGTKWNASQTIIKDRGPDTGLLEFSFETAWSFPEPVFDAISQEFPSLHFQCATYEESGSFAGHGYFNPPPGEAAFEMCDPDDDLYEIVYGQPPEHEDEDSGELELDLGVSDADDGEEPSEEAGKPVWSI